VSNFYICKRNLITILILVLSPGFSVSLAQQNIVNGDLIQFSNNGAWCWYQDERAVVDISNNKIIIASNRTSNGHDYVDIYDISEGTTQNYDLGSIGSDDHDTPGLLIRPDGKYLAMYAKHNSDKITHYRIFNNGSWSTEQTFNWNTQPGGDDFATTYSNVYYLSAEDRTYDLSRGNGHGGQNFLISSDQGNTWSYGGFLTTNANIGYVNGYFKYCNNGVNRIDFVCTEYHPRDFNTSIYHGYIKDGQTFKSDGTLVDDNIFDKNPTTPQDYTPVFQANTVLNGFTMTHCWNTDIQRYSDGTIATIVTARTNTDSNNPTHAFIYCRNNGSTWSSTYLGNAGLKLYSSEQDYTGLAAMHPNTPDIIYISAPYDPRDGTFLTKHEIFKGVTRDNGATWDWTPITQNSDVDNLRPIVPVWENYKTALIWFRGTYNTAQNINAQIVGIITDEASTSIEVKFNLKMNFKLYQNFPNPFNPNTSINWQIPESSFVTLKVFDILGNEVSTLVNEQKDAGIYNNQFSTINYQLPSGIYIFRLDALSKDNPSRNYVQTRKMILLK
jgi:hypothetical protein